MITRLADSLGYLVALILLTTGTIYLAATIIQKVFEGDVVGFGQDAHNSRAFLIMGT